MKYFLPIILLTLLLAGCRTNYKNQAVEKARAFALAHVRDLTELQRSQIEYGAPTFRQAVITKGRGSKPAEDDLLQTSIVWELTGRRDIVVFGTGERSMQDWEPLRILQRKTSANLTKEERKAETRQRLYNAATNKARQYVMDNMLFLKAAVRNHIRFAEPKVYTTSFAIEKLLKKNKKELTIWERLTKKKEKKMQFALVWRPDSSPKPIVVIGVGEKLLKNWKPVLGIHHSEEYFKKHCLKAFNYDQKRKE